jgi:hypothetical protein
MHNVRMPGRPPLLVEMLLNLPYPIVALWVIWGALVPWQLGYLFRRNPQAHKIDKTGELMNFREVMAVGCVAGFILLSFITAFCTYITWKLAKLI